VKLGNCEIRQFGNLEMANFENWKIGKVGISRLEIRKLSNWENGEMENSQIPKM
jgi:hypothetical protein